MPKLLTLLTTEVVSLLGEISNSKLLIPISEEKDQIIHSKPKYLGKRTEVYT